MPATPSYITHIQADSIKWKYLQNFVSLIGYRLKNVLIFHMNGNSYVEQELFKMYLGMREGCWMVLKNNWCLMRCVRYRWDKCLPGYILSDNDMAHSFLSYAALLFSPITFSDFQPLLWSGHRSICGCILHFWMCSTLTVHTHIYFNIML